MGMNKITDELIKTHRLNVITTIANVVVNNKKVKVCPLHKEIIKALCAYFEVRVESKIAYLDSGYYAFVNSGEVATILFPRNTKYKWLLLNYFNPKYDHYIGNYETPANNYAWAAGNAEWLVRELTRQLLKIKYND